MGRAESTGRDVGARNRPGRPRSSVFVSWVRDTVLTGRIAASRQPFLSLSVLVGQWRWDSGAGSVALTLAAIALTLAAVALKLAAIALTLAAVALTLAAIAMARFAAVRSQEEDGAASRMLAGSQGCLGHSCGDRVIWPAMNAHGFRRTSGKGDRMTT
jgi:hypothetical protein